LRAAERTANGAIFELKRISRRLLLLRLGSAAAPPSPQPPLCRPKKAEQSGADFRGRRWRTSTRSGRTDTAASHDRIGTTRYPTLLRVARRSNKKESLQFVLRNVIKWIIRIPEGSELRKVTVTLIR